MCFAELNTKIHVNDDDHGTENNSSTYILVRLKPQWKQMVNIKSTAKSTHAPADFHCEVATKTPLKHI